MFTRAGFRRITIENRSSRPYGAMTSIDPSSRRVSPTAVAYSGQDATASSSELSGVTAWPKAASNQ
ncbi:conserved hypothetical protein, partial [Ricinus communis]